MQIYRLFNIAVSILENDASQIKNACSGFEPVHKKYRYIVQSLCQLNYYSLKNTK